MIIFFEGHHLLPSLARSVPAIKYNPCLVLKNETSDFRNASREKLFQNLNGFFHKPSSIIQQETLFKSCFERDASVP